MYVCCTFVAIGFEVFIICFSKFMLIPPTNVIVS